MKALNDPVVQIVEGDQSKDDVLNKLCRKGPFDVIMDDASHMPAYFTVVKELICAFDR